MKTVYLLYTQSPNCDLVLLDLYKKSHYQAGLNRIMNIYNRDTITRKINFASNSYCVEVLDTEVNQRWWIESREVK